MPYLACQRGERRWAKDVAGTQSLRIKHRTARTMLASEARGFHINLFFGLDLSCIQKKNVLKIKSTRLIINRWLCNPGIKLAPSFFFIHHYEASKVFKISFIVFSFFKSFKNFFRSGY